VKITDVEAIVLRRHDPVRDISDGTQDTLVVRIRTDAGLVGIGEVDSAPEVVKAAIEAPKSHLTCTGFRQLLLGEDPRDVGRLWEKLYRGSLYFGRRGVGIHALSGIDIALWDLCGKALGQPVHRLLGGAHRDRVRAYASTLMPETPAEAGREAERWAAQGFTAVKLGWGGFGRSLDTDVALVETARRAVGDRVTLMFDIGLAWDAATAIRQVQRMERFEPYWIEEPLMPDDLRGYRRLADAVDTRIACGEQSVTRWEFEQLLDEGRVDVIQPDIAHAGGLTETRRIAELARLRGVPCVPHAFKTGILKAATLHLLAALPEAPFLEFCVWDSPLAHDLVHPRFWIDGDGMVAVPQGPGLGIALDEQVLERYRVA
jgi:L-rhamnonate dehydratase